MVERAIGYSVLEGEGSEEIDDHAEGREVY